MGERTRRDGVVVVARLLWLKLRSVLLLAWYQCCLTVIQVLRRLRLFDYPPLEPPAMSAKPIHCLGPTGDAEVSPDDRLEHERDFYLSATEKAEFEDQGILGPFRLFSEEEAAELARRSREDVVPDEMLLGQEIREYVGEGVFSAYAKRMGLQGIHGFWQHLRLPYLDDIVRRPEITHRLASILGEDLMCWRSQFFEKRPGTEGTYWHQATTFREGSVVEKLSPTQDKGSGLIQCTVWLALTDSTIENGCLRFMTGSVKDSYLADRENQLLDRENGHLILKQLAPHLTAMSFSDRLRSLKILLSPEPFPKSKWLMEEIVPRERKPLFDDYPIRDIEMKAGEFVIFTSLVIHGAYPNISEDDTRLAFVGRYTTNDVKVYDQLEFDTSPAIQGKEFQMSLANIGCTQVHGEDRFGYNKMVPPPTSTKLDLATAPKSPEVELESMRGAAC